MAKLYKFCLWWLIVKRSSLLKSADNGGPEILLRVSGLVWRASIWDYVVGGGDLGAKGCRLDFENFC